MNLIQEIIISCCNGIYPIAQHEYIYGSSSVDFRPCCLPTLVVDLKERDGPLPLEPEKTRNSNTAVHIRTRFEKWCLSTCAEFLHMKTTLSRCSCKVLYHMHQSQRVIKLGLPAGDVPVGSVHPLWCGHSAANGPSLMFVCSTNIRTPNIH